MADPTCMSYEMNELCITIVLEFSTLKSPLVCKQFLGETWGKSIMSSFDHIRYIFYMRLLNYLTAL